jgi:hypothetical protein
LSSSVPSSSPLVAAPRLELARSLRLAALVAALISAQFPTPPNTQPLCNRPKSNTPLQSPRRMTASELNKRWRTYRRQRDAFACAFVILSGIAMLLLAPRIAGSEQLYTTAGYVLVLSWAASLLVVGLYSTKLFLRRNGLVCPSCGRPLECVATLKRGTCPRCHKHFIEPEVSRACADAALGGKASPYCSASCCRRSSRR